MANRAGDLVFERPMVVYERVCFRGGTGRLPQRFVMSFVLSYLIRILGFTASEPGLDVPYLGIVSVHTCNNESDLKRYSARLNFYHSTMNASIGS